MPPANLYTNEVTSHPSIDSHTVSFLAMIGEDGMVKYFGETVGRTTSGKAVVAFFRLEIRTFPHPSTADFTIHDHYEAFAIFAYLTVRSKRRWGDHSEDYVRYYDHSMYHRSIPGLADAFEDVRLRSGVVNAFEEIQLGRKLCRPEFRDE